MKQPVFVIKREKVISLFTEQVQLVGIPSGLSWGKLQSRDELLSAINNLKREADDTIDLSRLVQCIQAFHAEKRINGTNHLLEKLWRKIKENRIQI